MGIFNVCKYGAVGDGKTLNTKAIQNTIDECARSGGGTVYFPAGEFVCSTLFLRDNVSVRIDKEARVLGSLNFQDYQPDEKVEYPLYQDASHSFFHCSMFVGENCKNISIFGGGCIDMRSVWDEENVRDMAHRGAKCIALKCCENVRIENIGVFNATDLAIYFAGCKNVEISRIEMRVYIDGISPDNSENVRIEDCEIETGDDGIVLKSSYTLNRLGVCKNITVKNCKIKSRCNGFKIGTETNGGFENIVADGLEIYETRLAGIALETVDGAIIDGLTIRNVKMKNVYAPLYMTIGDRLRGPEGTRVGAIKNVLLENITAEGPYEPYEVIAWNYSVFKTEGAMSLQEPWRVGKRASQMTKEDVWQTTSNVCGHKESPIKNLCLRNINLVLDGGAGEYITEVPEEKTNYPEVYVLGKALPAKGIYFRRIDGLTLDNVTVATYRPDSREELILDKVKKQR